MISLPYTGHNIMNFSSGLNRKATKVPTKLHKQKQSKRHFISHCKVSSLNIKWHSVSKLNGPENGTIFSLIEVIVVGVLFMSMVIKVVKILQELAESEPKTHPKHQRERRTRISLQTSESR